METFETIVVGGGPAGTSTAMHLAQAPGGARGDRSIRTMVLERHRHPREKPCAGAVSSIGLETLQQVGYELDVPHVKIDGIRIRFGATVTTHRRPNLCVVVRRSEFDHALWRAAGRSGVVMRDGERVKHLRRDGDSWIVTTDRDTYRTRVVVGADGSGSTVRRLAGFAEPTRKGRLYVLETPPMRAIEREPLLDFDLTCVADGIEGYYWDFPTIIDGAPAVSRGIYHLNRSPRRDLKQVLATYLERRGIDPEQVTYKPFSERGFDPRSAISKPGLLLVGEAAGIDPVTGEGIAQAIVFGQIAAQTIRAGLATGDLSFSGYAQRLRRTTMARHLGQSNRLSRHVYGHRSRQFASFLASRPEAVAMGARWYEGRALGKGELLRVGLSLSWALVRRKELSSGALRDQSNTVRAEAL